MGKLYKPEQWPAKEEGERKIMERLKRLIRCLQKKTQVTTDNIHRIIAIINIARLSDAERKALYEIFSEIIRNRPETDLQSLPKVKTIAAAVREQTTNLAYHDRKPPSGEEIEDSRILETQALTDLKDNGKFRFFPALLMMLQKNSLFMAKRISDNQIAIECKESLEEDEESLAKALVETFQELKKKLDAFNERMYDESFKRDCDKPGYQEEFHAHNDDLRINTCLLQPCFAQLERHCGKLLAYYDWREEVKRTYRLLMSRKKGMRPLVRAQAFFAISSILIRRAISKKKSRYQLMETVKAELLETLKIASVRVAHFHPLQDI